MTTHEHSATNMGLRFSLSGFLAFKCIGQGSYGTVFHTISSNSNQMRAIKRISFPSEREGIPVDALREAAALKRLVHKNIVKLFEVRIEKRQLYLIFELLPRDLGQLMKLAKKKGNFGIDMIKRFMKDILAGINFIHSRGMIHRDIKPTNILVAANFDLKLCDFGFCRNIEALGYELTPKIGSPWYYSPEVCLDKENYGLGVDMWAVGCIFAELYNLTSLFEGCTKLANLLSIFEKLGSPTEENWPDFSALEIPVRFKELPRVSLKKLVPAMSSLALDLLDKFLAYSPLHRCSAITALYHPYFNQDDLLKEENSTTFSEKTSSSSWKCNLL